MFKLLIVEDSSVDQRIIANVLNERLPGCELTFVADAYAARESIARQTPDAILLDLELPRMSGEDFLRCLMTAYPLPVVVVTRLSNQARDMGLINMGAVAIVPKPSSVGQQQEFGDRIYAALCNGIGICRTNLKSSVLEPATNRSCKASLIAIGSSTGGPQALEAVLSHLPVDCPPVIVAQHLSDRFIDSLASRLGQVCQPSVVVAVDGVEVQPGTVYLIPPSGNMRLSTNLRLKQTPPEIHHRYAPSVDELFDSLVAVRPHSTIAVMLTGMGSDGAEGIRKLHDAGATTFAQDEATCAVFGMPKRAIDLKAVDHVLPLNQIGPALCDWDPKSKRKRSKLINTR